MFDLLINYSYASMFNSFNIYIYVCSLFISISFSNWLMILLLDYSKCLILCPSILFFLPGLVNGYNQGFFLFVLLYFLNVLSY